MISQMSLRPLLCSVFFAHQLTNAAVAAAAASLPRLCLGTQLLFFLSFDRLNPHRRHLFISLSQFSPFLNILQIFYHFPDLKKQRVKFIFLIRNSGTKPGLKYSSTKFNYYKGEWFFPKAILICFLPKVQLIFCQLRSWAHAYPLIKAA